MKKTHNVVFATTLTLLAAGGCKKHDAALPATAGSASAAMTGSAGSGATNGSAAIAGSAATTGSAATPDVPTPADFEAQAAADITDKNLDTSLDEVEKELGK
jgi:hypothetical protein